MERVRQVGRQKIFGDQWRPEKTAKKKFLPSQHEVGE